AARTLRPHAPCAYSSLDPNRAVTPHVLLDREPQREAVRKPGWAGSHQDRGPGPGAGDLMCHVDRDVPGRFRAAGRRGTVPSVRTGPVVGLVGQLVLLDVLARTVGLGAAGWLAGMAYGLVTCAALTRGLHRSGATALGPADRVTLTRATLVGGVAALTV